MVVATERLRIKLHSGRFVHAEMSDLGRLVDELWRLGLHHRGGVTAAVKFGQVMAGFHFRPYVQLDKYESEVFLCTSYRARAR